MPATNALTGRLLAVDCLCFGMRLNAPSDWLTGAGLGVRIVQDDENAVNQNAMEAGGVLVRLFEGGVVLDSDRVEHDQVSPGALANNAAVFQAKGGGWERSHFADGVLEAQDFEFA